MGNTPNIAQKHYLTVTEEHFTASATQATATPLNQAFPSQDQPSENWGLTGDKLGTQLPAGSVGDAQRKTRTVHSVRENVGFSEIVTLFEKSQVAEEGLEPPTRGL